VEPPYLPCPAGPDEIAAALVSVPFEGALIRLVPGLTDTDDSGTPEVMRGEETQIVGVLPEIDDGIACLPGSHSKWARIANGRISAYRTYLSGEAFAALRGGTILGRMMKDGPTDEAAFDRGLARAADHGHLLHHLFGVRTLGLFGQLGETESASYLSGLLIGHEVRAARPEGQSVHLIGAAQLCALYARAIAACGAQPYCRMRTPLHAGSRRSAGGRDGTEILAGTLPAGRHPARGAAGRGRGNLRRTGSYRHRHRRGAAEFARSAGEHRPAGRTIRGPHADRRRHGDDHQPGP
jgi:hypothetical protein